MLVYLSMLETPQEKSKFEQIYHTYKNLMLHTAYLVLGDSRDTEDAVHQAFLKIIENLEKIDEIKCHKTRAFIVTIIERTAIDLYRQRKRRSAVPMDEAYINVPARSEVEKVPGYTDLERAMAALPTRYRQVILLRYDSELSYEEIARILSTNPANVRKLVERAKAQLRAKLEEQEV